MRLLSALERFFERLFERPSARLFRTRLQPVHLQRRIERAMELARLSGADRTWVPNRFTVLLNPADLDAFGGMLGSLTVELADGALAFARTHRYALTDRPRVEIAGDAAVQPGDIRVLSAFEDPNDQPVDPVAIAREPGTATPANAAGDATGGDVPVERTMVYAIPEIDGPLALLRELRPDGSQREVRVDGRLLTIGRADENALVLRDARVSRFHGRLQARRGALVYTDLGSTNGSRVNGAAIREVVLGEGDRIELGDTVLLVESVAAD